MELSKLVSWILTSTMVAAWVRFPQLEVAPLAQRYTRIKEFLYRCESRSGAFSAMVEVDNLGLVVEYEGISVRGKRLLESFP